MQATLRAVVICILMVALTTAPALARPKVAVILAGGAARGFSHLGLLQALEEHGIPVDMLVSTSMGSIVAGLYASGLSTENIRYLATEVDFTQIFSPILPPRGGIITTDKFRQFLDAITDNAQIENTPIPFYPVFTNIITGEEVILKEGPVSLGIVASMSIPGLFPPVEINGEYFVDGGMKSPVPVNATRSLGADFVIAVDAPRELSVIDHDSILTNVQLTLFFLLEANTAPQRELADIVISPAVRENSYMEFDNASAFIQEGYVAGIEAIPRIKAALLELYPEFPFGDTPPPAGIDHAVLQDRVNNAMRQITRESAGSPAGIRLQSEFAPNEHPHWDLSAHLSIGKMASTIPVAAALDLSGNSQQWTYDIGVRAGDCTSLACVYLQGRRGPSDGRWSPVVKAAGIPAGLVHYEAEWEASSLAADGQPQWSVHLRGPVPSRDIIQGPELTLDVQQDARGLFGRPDGRLKARGMYRHYFAGTMQNYVEVLRGAPSYYIGAGLQITRDGSDFLTVPVGEAGIVFEGRMFGLYPLKMRLAARHLGPDNPLSVWWTLGD